MGRWGLAICLLLPSFASATSQSSDAPSEFTVSLGAHATTQTYEGGGTTTVFSDVAVSGVGRFYFGTLPALTLDGWALIAPPLTPNLSPTSLSLAARVGVELRHFAVAVGPAVNLAPASPNLAQWLPSLTLKAGAGMWWGVLGLFDRPELPILRAGIEYRSPYGDYGLAYVLLGGAELTGRWWVAPFMLLHARLLISQQPLGNGLSTAIVGLTLPLPAVKP